MHTARQVLLPAALLLSACSATEPNMHRVTVSAAVAPIESGVHPTAAISADLVITGDGGSVKVSSAELALSRMKLADNEPCEADSDDVEEPEDSVEHSPAHDSADVEHDDDSTDVDHDSTDVDHDSTDVDNDSTDHGEDHGDQGENGDHQGEDHEGCASIQSGSASVDLPLDGTSKVILDALVPAGTYTRLQARLTAAKVVGVFTDAAGTDHAFTFTSPMDVVSAANFSAPITVGAGTTHLTIGVDVSSWFKNTSGALIDPRNSVNRYAIERNIRASLRAFSQ